jgi:hypothetical protein
MLRVTLTEDECGAMAERYRQGETEVLGENRVPVPVGQQQVSHELIWD